MTMSTLVLGRGVGWLVFFETGFLFVVLEPAPKLGL